MAVNCLNIESSVNVRAACKERQITNIILCSHTLQTTSPAVVKCCQLAFNFLPVNTQLDIRTANFLQKFIASDNSLCCLFALTARRQLNELFVLQFDNVATAFQFHNAIPDSLNCFNDD